MAVATINPTSRRWTQNEVTDDRATLPSYFADFDRRHGPFTVDVAAAAHNTKCARFYDSAADGLAQDWSGERVWCNPPYSDIAPWVAKAWECWSATRGIAMLLPASRTEQRWWQQLVEPYRDRRESPLTVEFLPGRMHFLRPGQTEVGPGERPPFGCALLVWHDPQARRRRESMPALPGIAPR
jgi:phage N-6-adenine-methyltransferase